MSQLFAQYLTRFRVRRGLSKAALAEALGASRMSIIDWETGRRVPRDRARLIDLAQVLQLSPSEADQLIAAVLRQRQRPDDGVAAALHTSIPDPSAAASLHQLRAPVADFVGRAAETAQVISAMRAIGTQGGVAIISGIHGMGGIGKTELAYHVADQLQHVFLDAQIVLDLRGSSSAPLAPIVALQQVIRAFVRDEPLAEDLNELQQRYRTLLHNRCVLILADDAYSASQVRPLLPPAGCALLITSRQRFTLPGMASVDLDQLSEADSVTLLSGISKGLREAEAQAIAQICGYLPLALRISASILRNNPALDVAVYRARLADERQRLRHLRDPDDGQLDVEATLALSYAQLDGPVQQVFRQLGVLVSDFDSGLARAIVDVKAEIDIEAILHHLLRRNLIMYNIEQARWRLHDLVRDVARHCLAEQELAAVAQRYTYAAVGIAFDIQGQYDRAGEGAEVSLARFDTERLHIDAAWRWGIEQAGTVAGDRLLIKLALATKYVGAVRYQKQTELIPWLRHACAAAERLGDREDAGQVVNILGRAFGRVGDGQRARPCFEKMLLIGREIGDRLMESQALNNLGVAFVNLGDEQRAIPYLEEALQIAREIGDRLMESMALNNLGEAFVNLGDTQRAIPYLEELLRIVPTIDNRRLRGEYLSDLGCAFAALGDTRQAITCSETALAIAHTFGDRRLEGCILIDLGRFYARQSATARAYTAFEQALTILCEVDDRRGIAKCRWDFGLFLAGQGERERALALLRESVTYKQESGHAKAPAYAALLAHLEADQELADIEQMISTMV